MTTVPDPAAGVLISGLYGTGKSSVTEEIATRLNRAGLHYAALDLDWLMWFDVGDDEMHERVSLENVVDVVSNYLDAGVRHFVMAGLFEDQREVDAYRATLPFPLTLVELRVPLAEIERRLRASPNSGRSDDLHHAQAWVESRVLLPRPDLTIDGDRPIMDVAGEIIDALRWTA